MKRASTYPSGEGAVVSDYALACLPRQGAGRVHSVFATSLNVAFDGLLLHLGPIPAGLSCLGATLGQKELDALLAVARPGDTVRVHDERLRFYCLGGTPVVSLAELPVADCHVVAVGACERALLLGMLGSLDLLKRSGLAGLGRLGDVTEALVHGLERPEALESCASYLVGRGPGLTPSGDDMLVGYGVGLLMGSERAVVSRLVGAQDLARTTDVSAAYLKAIADGHANLAYRKLGHALVAHDGSAAWAALQELVGVGHTSGADGLLGLSAALRALCNASDTRRLVA